MLREVWIKGLTSEPSTKPSDETLDFDIWPSDKVDGKLCSPKNFRSSSVGEKQSKLLKSKMKVGREEGEKGELSEETGSA